MALRPGADAPSWASADRRGAASRSPGKTSELQSADAASCATTKTAPMSGHLTSDASSLTEHSALKMTQGSMPSRMSFWTPATMGLLKRPLMRRPKMARHRKLKAFCTPSDSKADMVVCSGGGARARGDGSC